MSHNTFDDTDLHQLRTIPQGTRGESENVPWTRTTTIPYSSGYIPGHSRSSLHEALFLVVKRVLTLYG
jgi:hypothetical protein